jgi:hypothetical protein
MYNITFNEGQSAKCPKVCDAGMRDWDRSCPTSAQVATHRTHHRGPLHHTSEGGCLAGGAMAVKQSTNLPPTSHQPTTNKRGSTYLSRNQPANHDPNTGPVFATPGDTSTVIQYGRTSTDQPRSQVKRISLGCCSPSTNKTKSPDLATHVREERKNNFRRL